MVFSRQQPSGDLAELFRSTAPLVIMDKEAAGSGGCSTTFHGRLGAGVTISIDAVPSVFGTGLITQHPICCKLFNLGRGVQGNAADRNNVAAAAAALSAKAVQQVSERFETACDDLDSGLLTSLIGTATAACSSRQALLKATTVWWTATAGAWRAATRCTVTGAGKVASTPSSRPPRAPTTAAVAALAALRSSGPAHAVGHGAGERRAEPDTLPTRPAAQPAPPAPPSHLPPRPPCPSPSLPRPPQAEQPAELLSSLARLTSLRLDLCLPTPLVGAPAAQALLLSLLYASRETRVARPAVRESWGKGGPRTWHRPVGASARLPASRRAASRLPRVPSPSTASPVRS